MPSTWNGKQYECIINPDTSHLKFLSIKGLRTDRWECGVCRRTAKEHETSSWCAGYQNERKPGSLFDAVRAYLEHLKFIGELRDDMSDAERIDAVYVLYKQIRLAASLVGFVSFKQLYGSAQSQTA